MEQTGRIEGLRHHLRNRLQDAVQIALRRDRLGHGRQRLHALDGAFRMLGIARFGDRAAHLLADERKQRHFVRRVGVLSL